LEFCLYPVSHDGVGRTASREEEKIMDPNTIAAQPAEGTSRRSWTSHEFPGAYERRPCPGAPWTSLDETALSAYFAEPESAVPDTAARTVQEGFSVRRDSALQPTVAGYALFGVHPERQRPAWRVIALRIAGTDRSAPVVDRLDTEGPAPKEIAQVEAFLRRHLHPAHAGGQQTQDYSLPAALEALANAVAHRDYAAPLQVFVRLYNDRLEIESPGGLLPGAVPDAVLAGGESHPRNPVIAGVLRRMGLMAEAGRGLPLIREESADLGLPPPEFAAEAHTFRVTLRPRR
jgi:predicted HTH transcriptional regulator